MLVGMRVASSVLSEFDSSKSMRLLRLLKAN